MKRFLLKAAVLPFILLATSCYEDYLKDYNYSSAYFSSQKPLRTVIADRDMAIKVGVAIGGKREVDPNDWAQFEIVPELLDGSSYALMPESYYTLSSPDKMTISKASLPIADVQIKFTEDFYNDPEATKLHYVIPFRVVTSSLDSLLDGKTTSLVAVKYLSTYHGTYYVKGVMKVFDANGTELTEEKVTYENKDLSRNITRAVNTVSRKVLNRAGVGNFPTDAATDKVQLTFNEDKTITVKTADGGIEITDGSGSYDDVVEKLTLTLKYSFKKGDKTYKVEETLIRRIDPYKELVFEEY